MASHSAPVGFSDLLQQAVTEPGLISAAYSQFHSYSLGNVLLAAFQCASRDLPLGPLATFPRWRELGRHVKKGQKAITLCQPVTTKRTADDGADPEFVVRFVYRPHWFVLAQTEGAEILPAAEIPRWSHARALTTLDVIEVPFSHPDGNVMGYARHREIAVSPLNPLPRKTLFHELAHVLLGHTAELEQADDERTPGNIREVEAEAVALLCCEALGLEGAAFCRGYIQHWIGAGTPIQERSAQRILRIADQIIRAGHEDRSGES